MTPTVVLLATLAAGTLPYLIVAAHRFCRRADRARIDCPDEPVWTIPLLMADYRAQAAEIDRKADRELSSNPLLCALHKSKATNLRRLAEELRQIETDMITHRRETNQ